MSSSSSVFFSGLSSAVDKPRIKSISIPEAKKRRQPSKHYVYKIVVQWSNGKSTVIYRRYSMFFDFQVKLQELYSVLKERNPLFQGDNCPILPELPGKVLFGRTQVHQVAEKRRVKIEEFCEALVTLPSDISESALVLGFFNTWPDDTMQHYPLTREPSSPSVTVCTSPTSPTSSVINHPDEMENLEQYRAIVDYDRKDNHQVNLITGQIVHVIEKHYTGWWMIVTDEEQGYAPAAHLEAIDKTYDTAEFDDNNNNEEFEVMDTYKAENDDEIELFPGDRVVILNKSMDGWWKIKNSYGVEGYCPATILRKSENAFQRSPMNTSYESEKDLYQELNIHKPPPRRSTLERKQIFKLHKTPNTKQRSNDPFFEDHAHYQVPRNSSSVSSGSDENPTHSVDLTNPPFSPNHYEIGPCFNEDNNMIHPIYENTEFEPNEDLSNSNDVYQNMELIDKPSDTPKQRKPPSEHNEYINPIEFSRDENNMTTQNAPPTSKPGTTNVNYKQVTIASMPLSPPTTMNNKTDQVENPSHSVKAILTNSKSLGFIDTSPFEEEYIEMDPIYAPVAPDEPKVTSKGISSDEASVTQNAGAGKKQKPTVPPPPIRTNKPVVTKVGSVPTPLGRVLERTKSLEDILSFDEGYKKQASPIMKMKMSNNKNSNHEYDHLEVTEQQSNSNSSSPVRKPEAAKKPFHKSIVGSSPSSPGEFRKINSPPVSSPPRDITDGPPSVHPPIFSPSHSSKGPFVPKTYIAIESYNSQAAGCLGFNAGDRCILVRQSNGGWWFVNIGGKEGWTPGDFWQEDSRSMPGTLTQPPSVAPTKPITTKPRSQTHIGANSPFDKQLNNNNISVIGQDSARTGSVGTKPLPGKPRGQPPPKPHPVLSPLHNGSKKLEHSMSLDPSVPPPPPPPRKGSNAPFATNGESNKTKDPINDYTLLEYASMASLEDQKWFAGSMEREKAEQFLMEHGRQREFLVRERANRKGFYALSIRYHYSVKHFNIDPQSNGSYSMGVMNFSSIEEVVKHYQLNSLFIHDGQPVALGQPARHKSRNNH